MFCQGHGPRAKVATDTDDHDDVDDENADHGAVEDDNEPDEGSDGDDDEDAAGYVDGGTVDKDGGLGGTCS